MFNSSLHAALFTLDGQFYRDLGGAPSDDQAAYALTVNDVGQAAGYSESRAVLFSAGRIIKIPGLPYFTDVHTSSRALGINRAGQVVGWEASDSKMHGFLYTNGNVTDLGEGSFGAINSQGTIVGKHLSGGQWHAVRIIQETSHDLGVLPGDNASAAAAVNESGVVVGSSAGPGHLSPLGRPRVRAFIYTNGMKALPSLPTDYQTVAQGISKNGTIVGCGFQFDSRGNVILEHGVVWLGGKVYDLNKLVPAGSLDVGCAYGINILEQIITGTADTVGSLLLTPVGRK